MVPTPERSPSSKTSQGRAPVPFRLKLTLLGGGLALVPLAIVGLLLLDVNARAVEVTSREFQLAVLDDVARSMDEALADAQDTLDAVGRVLTDRNLNGANTERLAANLLAGQARVDHAGVYRLNGTFIDAFAEAQSDAQLPPTLDAGLRDAARRDGAAYGAVDADEDGPRLLIVLPLRVESEVSGYVATRLSLRSVQNRIDRLHEVRFEGRDDALFVVDEERRFVLHPDRARLLEPANEPLLEGIRTTGERYQQSGEFERAGAPMVGTVLGLHSLGWLLAAQVPQSHAYASLDRMRRIVLGTILVVLLMALVAAFVVAKQITRPISELADFAGDLAARRFDRRITVTTRDELGLLGSALSHAAADLEASESRIREEVAIRTDLGRYLPQDLVEKVVAREQDMALGGGRRDVSVLFADVVAFTPVTEQMAAEDVVSLLNELFTILSEIVFRHEGTIDKFIGDCV
ncbi:MAG: adenylate/guanylate cyclase domain-containing protein, partial [Myxococcota bacterium]